MVYIQAPPSQGRRIPFLPADSSPKGHISALLGSRRQAEQGFEGSSTCPWGQHYLFPLLPKGILRPTLDLVHFYQKLSLPEIPGPVPSAPVLRPGFPHPLSHWLREATHWLKARRETGPHGLGPVQGPDSWSELCFSCPIAPHSRYRGSP